MRNHYVSQLIMKRYSESLNTFKYGDATPLSSVNSKTTFFKRGIFTDENEAKMAQNIEDPIAKILDKKIIGKNEIVLSRKELYLLKHYFLIDSIRTQFSDFAILLKRFISTCERYLGFVQFENIKIDHLPRLKSLKLTNQEILNLSMKIVIETRSLYEMTMHPDSFLEIVCWAKPFYDAFLTFWDSFDEEFILTDNGMTTEYETTHYIFNGLDISKSSYLQHHLVEASKNNNTNEVLNYVQLINKNILMFENFSVFNLSAKRVIVMSNPFFRLFSEKGFRYHDGDKINNVKANIPDIWPSVIQTKEAFKVPKNKYMLRSSGQYTMNDLFIYEPYCLTRIETIYINSLFLSQTREKIGYNELSKIVDSIGCYIKEYKKEHLAKHGNIKKVAELRYTPHPLEKLIKFGKKNGINCSNDIAELFVEITRMKLKDLNNNYYIYEKLVKELPYFQDIENHFGFLGSKSEIEKKINYRYNILKNNIAK